MFNPSKPDPGPSPKDDVGQIQTNFAQFAAKFAQTIAGINYNHTALNARNQGDHETVLMENQANDPSIVGDECILYNKNGISNAGSQPQLFVRIPNFLPHLPDTTQNTNLPIQLTYNTVNTAGPSQFQSFLPRGALITAFPAYDTGVYLLYMGVDTGNTASNVLIADTITLVPAPTKILIAIAEPNTFTTLSQPQPFNVSTTITNNSQFVIHSNANGSGASIPYSFTWMAIALA